MFPSPIASYLIDTLPKQTEVRVCGIYAIKNRVTGNIYLGSSDHVVRRWRAHVSQLRRGVHHSLKLQWAWKNRGEDCFEFVLLELIDESLLIKRETDLLAQLSPKYNYADVADNPMKGRRHTDASKQKMALARKGKGTGPRTFSDDHRAKLSAAAKARDPETYRRGANPVAIKKMARTMKDRYASGQIKPRFRPVEINGVVYPSGRAAAAAFGINQSHLIPKIKAGFGRYCDDQTLGPTRHLTPYEPPRGADHALSKSIYVGEKLFSSISEAARHFGRNSSTLNYWLQRGKARYADGSPPPPLRRIYTPK